MSNFLTFDEGAHEYKFKGVIVPSVTQILQPLNDFSGIPPAILENKRQIGVAVHKACELYDDDDLDEESLTPIVADYFAAWKRFKTENEVVVEMSEQRIFHALHRYAGTLDRVLTLNGVRCVLDLKTSATLNPAVGLQLAAYDMALGVEKLKRFALQLKPNGLYKLQEYKDPKDYQVFTALLTLKNWRNQNEK